MTDLHLVLSVPPTRLLDAGQAMARRFHGLKTRVLLALTLFTAGLTSGLIIAYVFGVPWLVAALISVYALLGAILATALFQRLSARRYRAVFATSTLRQQAVPVTLSDAGITFGVRALPWSAVTHAARWQDCTLVHFSPVDALVIPDAALGELPPETLATRIADWKTQ